MSDDDFFEDDRTGDDEGAAPDAAAERQLDERAARDAALKLLTRREHSRFELTQKLAKRGATPAVSRSVLNRLADEGLQSDARYTESYLRERLGRGFGLPRVRAELRQHQIESTIIDAALAQQEDDPVGRAARLVEKKLGSRPPGTLAEPAERDRIMRFLAQRGFDFGHIRAAIDRVRAQEADDR